MSTGWQSEHTTDHVKKKRKNCCSYSQQHTHIQFCANYLWLFCVRPSRTFRTSSVVNQRLEFEKLYSPFASSNKRISADCNQPAGRTNGRASGFSDRVIKSSHTNAFERMRLSVCAHSTVAFRVRVTHVRVTHIQNVFGVLARGVFRVALPSHLLGRPPRLIHTCAYSTYIHVIPTLALCTYVRKMSGQSVAAARLLDRRRCQLL